MSKVARRIVSSGQLHPLLVFSAPRQMESEGNECVGMCMDGQETRRDGGDDDDAPLPMSSFLLPPLERGRRWQVAA
jgi:hypothetical protein